MIPVRIGEQSRSPTQLRPLATCPKHPTDVQNTPGEDLHESQTTRSLLCFRHPRLAFVFLNKNWHMQQQRRQPGFISLSFHSLPAPLVAKSRAGNHQRSGSGRQRATGRWSYHIHFKQKPISRGPQHAATVCASDACVVPLNTFGC